MSTTTFSETQKEQNKISVGEIVGKDSPFYFFYQDMEVPETFELTSIREKKNLQSLLERDQDFLKKEKEKKASSKFMSMFFSVFQTQNEDVKNLELLIPNQELITRYVSSKNYEQVISFAKDMNDYINFFERSFKQLMNEDRKTSEYAKLAKKDSREGKGGRQNTLLMSGKLRALKVAFDEVETSIEKSQSLFHYYESTTHVYRFLKFVGGKVVHQQLKTFICNFTISQIQATAIGAMLGPLVGGSVYMVFNMANVYRNLGTDEKESKTKWEKLKYSFLKSGLTGIVDVFKITICPLFGLSSIYVLLGSTIIEATLMMFDPKLDSSRAEELAKSYGEISTTNTNFIKEALLPSRASNTCRILSLLKVPLDWIATFPESVANLLFTTLFTQYENRSTYNLLLASNPQVKVLFTSLQLVNWAYKKAVYATGAMTYLCLFGFALHQYTPLSQFYSYIVESGIEKGVWKGDLLSSLRDGLLSTILKENQREWIKTALNFMCISTGLLQNLASNLQIEQGILSMSINFFYFMCENHKDFVKFMTRLTFQQVSPYLQSFLKANTQHYLSFAVPLVYQYMTLNPDASFDEYAHLFWKNMFYGAIAICLSVGVNIATTILQKDQKTIETLRQFDETFQKTPGFHFQLYYEKFKFALGNSLLFRFLDSTAGGMKNFLLGSFVDYVEVHFGRKNAFENVNFTNFVNLIAVDGYLRPKIESAVIDVVANADLLEKIKSMNEDINKVVSIKEDEIKQSLERQREDDKKKVEMLQRKVKENITMTDTDKEKSQKLQINPNASVLTQQDEIAIQNQMSALKYMEHYYEYVEETIKDKTGMHFKSADQNRLLGTILFTHFNPFVRPVVEPKILSALENDFKVQLANMEILTQTEYGEKLKLLEHEKTLLLAQMQTSKGKTSFFDFQEKADRINREYTFLRNEFQANETLKEMSSYLDTLNNIVLTNYSFQGMKNIRDVNSFYNHSMRVKTTREKLKTLFTQDAGRKIFEQERLIQENEMQVSLSAADESFVSKMKKMMQEKVEKVELKIKMEKKEEIKKSSSFFMAFQGIFDEVKIMPQKVMKKYLSPVIKGVCQFTMYILSLHMKEALHNVSEFELLEKDILVNEDMPVANKDILLETIRANKAREFEKLNATRSMVQNVFENAQQFSLSLTEDEKKEEEFSFFTKVNQAYQTLSSSSSSSSLSLETSEKTQTQKYYSTMEDITTDKSFSISFDYIFDRPSDQNFFAAPEMPYTGNTFTPNVVQNVSSFVSGTKVDVVTPGLKKVLCGKKGLCRFHNAFIDSLQKEDLKTIENIQASIAERVANPELTSYVNTQLFLAYFDPVAREKLSKIKVTETQKDKLREIFMRTSTYEHRGRYFRDHFEGKELDWSNPHLLYFFTHRQYSQVAAEEILGRNNLGELKTLLQPLQKELEQEKLLEAEAIEKLKAYQMNAFEVEEKRLEKERLEKERLEKERLEKEEKERIEKEKREEEEKLSEASIFHSVWSVAKSTLSITRKVVSHLLTPTDVISTISSHLFSTGLFSNNVQETIAKIQLKLDTATTEDRNVEKINQILSDQIESIQNQVDKANLLSLKAEWLKHASRVDELVYEKEVKIIQKSNQWKSDIVAYSSLFVSITGSHDMTGIMSPSFDDILGMFFADDKYGLKQYFINLKENMAPESLKNLVAQINLFKQVAT